MVLENGVDVEHFAPRISPERRGFVYVGAIDRRFDWQVILHLAQAFPTEPVTLVGPTSVSVPELPSNVELIGPVAYESVPSIMHRASIGLLPYSDDPGNAGRSPMKFYEYLAAGLSVLAKASPTVDERQSVALGTYASAEEAVLVAGALLVQRPSDVDTARQFDWSDRAGRLLRFAGQL